jgi:hypothetical protein
VTEPGVKEGGEVWYGPVPMTPAHLWQSRLVRGSREAGSGDKMRVRVG